MEGYQVEFPAGNPFLIFFITDKCSSWEMLNYKEYVGFQNKK
jgi:hypothetical protein